MARVPRRPEPVYYVVMSETDVCMVSIACAERATHWAKLRRDDLAAPYRALARRMNSLDPPGDAVNDNDAGASPAV